jgi:hypothetical protein
MQVDARRSVMAALKLQWLVEGSGKVLRCCCMRRNPIVLIGYCVLTFGGFTAFIILGYPRIPNPYMDGYHK